MLTDLNPSIALADYIRDIKTSASFWLKTNPHFAHFDGWAAGYAALTYAWSDKDTVITYIKNQREHHKTTTFADEYRRLLLEHGVKIDEQFFP